MILKIYQSGEIWTNLVTLTGTVMALKVREEKKRPKD